MAWVLRHRDQPRNRFAALISGRTSYRSSAKCSHNKRTWRGGFNWDCSDCGEAIRDTEEKTQKTFYPEFINRPLS
jgi:hypothetical protein